MSQTARKILCSPLTWLAAALVLRLAYLASQQAHSPLFYQPLLDEEEMARAARQLLAGGGFGPEPLFKAPLYPLWLAAVMWASGPAWFFTARLAQHLLGAALVLLAWDATRRVTGGGRRGRWAGAAAAAALALYGPLIRLEDCLILDFFAVFFQSLMLWALIRLHGGFRPAIPSSPLQFPILNFKFLIVPSLWSALAGAAAAVSWLNRPTITPVLPLLALWIAWERGRPRPLRIPHSAFRIPHFFHSAFRIFPIPHSAFRIPHFFDAALFLLFPLLAMGAVWLRNARAGGEAMILPWQGGYNFYYANGLKANGKYLIQENYSLARTGNPTRELATGSADVSSALLGTPRYYHAINRYWRKKTFSEIAAAPARWLALLGRKLLYLTSAREIYNFEDYDVQRELSPILRWLPLSFGLLWPLALAGAALYVGRSCRAWPPKRSYHQRLSAYALLWLYFLSLGFAISLYYVSGRLRMPLVFPAVILASIAISDFLYSAFRIPHSAFPNLQPPASSLQPHSAIRNPKSAIRNPKSAIRNPKSAIVLLLFLLGCAMSWGDWWGVRSENLRHLEYARLSNAAWRAGDYPRALAHAEACQREHPGYPTAPLLRGQALYSLGRIGEAATSFQASLALLPADPIAAYNLGIIAYYDRPDPPRAAALFEEALRRQPAYASAIFMSALARLRLGQPARARELLAPCLPPPASAPEKLLIAAAALALAEKDRPSFQTYSSLIEKTGGPEALKRLAQEISLLRVP